MNPFFKNDPNEITSADIAMDASFIHWVRTNDPETGRYWTAWLERNPDMKEKAELARSMVLSLEFQEDVLVGEAELEAAWEQQRKLSGLGPVFQQDDQRRSSRHWNRFLGIAAALLFMAASSFVVIWYADQNSTSTKITSTAAPGQKLSITLSDGTNIKLNSGSTLEYPSQFTGDLREVKLKGEAYFNVTHNELAPFKVHSEGIIVTVLGTSFNVDAYPDDEAIRVALTEGKVKVNVNDGSKGNGDVLLSPSEIIEVNKSTHSYNVQQFDAQEITAWKDGALYLGRAGFNDTMVKLERWFGVKFEIDAEFHIDSNWRFTGKFQDKSLAYILETLSYPDLFRYRIDGRNVLIY